MSEVGIEATINRWDEPLALGVVDPHDSLSHPAGVSDVQAESATRIDPDQLTKFLVHSYLHCVCSFCWSKKGVEIWSTILNFLCWFLVYHFLPFLDLQIPSWYGGESGSTKDNPFPLPEAYLASQNRNVCFHNVFSIAGLVFFQYI